MVMLIRLINLICIVLNRIELNRTDRISTLTLGQKQCVVQMAVCGTGSISQPLSIQFITLQLPIADSKAWAYSLFSS